VKKEDVMRGRRMRALLATGVLVALVALALSACGGAQDAAQSGQDSNDPCHGVNGRLTHDHVFYNDGRFASVDQNGQFVDNDHYILPNDHTIVFPGSGSKTFPPVKAHFRFSDHLNTVTFDLVLPKNLDECSKHCKGVYAWAVSVFFSGLPWKRVSDEDLWIGEPLEVSAKGEKVNPLVGTWRRVRTCEEFVRRMKQAGLAEKISHQGLVEEFGTGQ
jgi:hypothetical protein